MICVCIRHNTLEECKAALEDIEMAEIRIDLTRLSEQEVQELFSYASIPLIATCRYDNMSDADRMILLKAAIKGGAAFVDVEIEAEDAFKKEMIAFAKDHNCRVIISYHNYENTPGLQTLQALIEQCLREGADVPKLATTAKSEADSARVMGLYDKNNSIVALAMGKKGKISRIAAPLLGAPFTFAAVNEEQATAPGQITREELQKIYNLI